MIPRRDDMLAKEEIFDGTMHKLFDFVMNELANAQKGIGIGVREGLQSIPSPYFDLFLLYQYHKHKHDNGLISDSNSIKEDEPIVKVSAYLEWRQKLQLQFNPTQVQAVLGGGSVDAMEMYRLMPECTLGRDKECRPVLYFIYARRDPHANNMAEIMKHVTTKHIFDYHLWQHEALVELCYHCSVVENRVISSCTLVMDIDHLSTENASAEFLHIASRRADLLHQYFPYLIGKILVVNANQQDLRLINHIRELCATMAPTATVYFSGAITENSSSNNKGADELLSQHIDTCQLPAEYGGTYGYSLATLSHPFLETMQLREAKTESTGRTRQGGGRVSPLLSLHLSLPAASSSVPLPPPPTNIPPVLSPPLSSSQTTGATSIDTSLQQRYDEEDSIYPPPSFTPSNLASVDSSRTFSSSSSKVPSNFFARSLSLSSPGGGANSGTGPLLHLPRAEDVLTSISMTPNARVALTAFVELFASNDIPITPANVQARGDKGDGYDGDEESEGENVVLTTAIDPSVFSVIRDGATLASVGCDMSTSLDFMRNITTSFYDTVAIKTAAGVAVLQKSQGDRQQPITCRKYQGSFALASGRVYLLSRGVSLSGWLQKYPMKSQSWGGATQRYFVLNSSSLRYWKGVPSPLKGRNEGAVKEKGGAGDDQRQDSGQGKHEQHERRFSTAEMGLELEACKGQITLTHETVVRRTKTLFGTNTIEIKSKEDTLTICAYTAAEDMAWFSELFNAVEKLKKVQRDLTAGSERNFPELTWRSPEPSCVALDVDVSDPTTVEDKEREFRNSGANKLPPTRSMPFGGTYAVLCRVKTGLSIVHSVQIGPYHHIPLRLENSDVDIGVRLSAVRLCGDCLVVSGSHGFVGSGRIPALEAPGLVGTVSAGGSEGGASGGGASASSGNASQRIYVRRMVNCFHGEDAHVTCLAVPRDLVISKAKLKPKGRSQSQTHEKSQTPTKSRLGRAESMDPSYCRGGGGDGSISSMGSGSSSPSSPNILASGDDIGGVCVWRREEGGRGVLHYPTYDGQQGKNKHRGGYSWQCVHRARIGHKITALSFSPNGEILSVTTPERAMLFDISQLLVDATAQPQDRRTRSGNNSNSNSNSNHQSSGTGSGAETDESGGANFFAVKSVVLDDLVGCTFSNSLLSYGVDLSTPGWVKVWKISSGSESRNSTQKGDKIQFMESSLDSVFNRLRNVKYVKPLRDLFPNTMGAPASPQPPANCSSTPSASNMARQLGQGRSRRNLISLSQDETDHCARDMDVDDMISDVTTKDTAAVHSSGVEVEQGVRPPLPPPLATSPHGINYTSNHDRDSSVLDGYSVDPFYYSDLCVIDPVRMHLRDWWCDYSSRYLLLGHARLTSLSTFETSINGVNPHGTTNSSIIGSLSSLSRTLNDSATATTFLSGGGDDNSESASTGGVEVLRLEAGRGLDRQSTTMFWSTLTNSLGRRVICRYYVPHGYYQRLRQCRQIAAGLQMGSSLSGSGSGSDREKSALGIAPLLEDCLRFCLTLSRCLYECLGDEYTQALLISWKAVALDSLREILERRSHAVFKDIFIFQEVLKRFELSPDLALSSLDDLIAVMENIRLWEADQLRQTVNNKQSATPTGGSGGHQGHDASSYVSTSTSKNVPPSLTSPLTSLYVESFFKNLKDTLSIVCDEQGLQSIIPSSRMIYICNGGIPPLNSANFQQVVEDYMAALVTLDVHSSICSIVHLLQSLVIDPLNHFERTEPFAVALCVVGLKGVPAYINDIIMTQQAETAPVVSSSISPSPPTASATSAALRNTVESSGKPVAGGGGGRVVEQAVASCSATDQNKQPEANDSVVYKDISIESLISKVAKDTPPWIRFVLTSDTDKVLDD